MISRFCCCVAGLDQVLVVLRRRVWPFAVLERGMLSASAIGMPSTNPDRALLHGCAMQGSLTASTELAPDLSTQCLAADYSQDYNKALVLSAHVYLL